MLQNSEIHVNISKILLFTQNDVSRVIVVLNEIRMQRAVEAFSVVNTTVDGAPIK